MIEEYYLVAPGVVGRIDQQPDRLSIYERIYQEYILPCVEHAKVKSFDESKRIYTQMVDTLKIQYA